MASKRRQRRRECESKHRFPTRETALDWRDRHRELADTDAYPCGFCAGFHLGHRRGFYTAMRKNNCRRENARRARLVR